MGAYDLANWRYAAWAVALVAGAVVGVVLRSGLMLAAVVVVAAWRISK